VWRLYPHAGHFNVYRRVVHVPDGSRPWDLLVIGADELPRFPEPTGPVVDRAAGLLLVAPPAR